MDQEESSSDIDWDKIGKFHHESMGVRERALALCQLWQDGEMTNAEAYHVASVQYGHLFSNPLYAGESSYIESHLAHVAESTDAAITYNILSQVIAHAGASCSPQERQMLTGIINERTRNHHKTTPILREALNRKDPINSETVRTIKDMKKHGLRWLNGHFDRDKLQGQLQKAYQQATHQQLNGMGQFERETRSAAIVNALTLISEYEKWHVFSTCCRDDSLAGTAQRRALFADFSAQVDSDPQRRI